MSAHIIISALLSRMQNIGTTMSITDKTFKMFWFIGLLLHVLAGCLVLYGEPITCHHR